MKSAPGVSVVICCYNSAERLPATLRHLSMQSVPEHIPWEVIAVDNASTDGSAEVARQLWLTTESRVPLRVVTQPIPGVSAARDQGVEEAAFEFIIFCDDDNWLGADYVRRVYELLVEHPHIGAIGGQGRAVGETGLPDWFARYSRYFAVGPQGDGNDTASDVEGYLYGAALAVRRSVLYRMKQLGVRRRLSDRTPGTLTSGGDVELGYLVRLSGYGLRFDPRLEFVHFMPSHRLHWAYFLDLVEAAHRSRPYLDAYLLALRDEAEGVGPLRWLTNCSKIAWRMLTRPKTLIAAIPAREGSRASYLMRRWRGEWTGWWTVRSDHHVLCRELVSLRRSLRRRAPRGTQGMMPADETWPDAHTTG